MADQPPSALDDVGELVRRDLIRGQVVAQLGAVHGVEVGIRTGPDVLPLDDGKDLLDQGEHNSPSIGEVYPQSTGIIYTIA